MMLFVDPAGDDAGPGTIDRPFATVDRARAAGLGIGIACTMVDKESDGRNIFGADFGTIGVDEVPFARLPVTRARVQALLNHINAGGLSNGVGLTQLTSPHSFGRLRREAEPIGPDFNSMSGSRSYAT